MSDATQATLPIGVLAIGQVIADRYEIRGLLGQGGMGSVYRALDRELDEQVALKVLRPDLAATPDALVRFRREVKLARRVTHPNIARTYDLGEFLGVRYLTMELVDGAPLRGPLAIPEILRIALELASGLAAAHAAGVVHRDLKPDNILVAGDRIVITDFGIASSESIDDALRTSGAVMGTPAYIAPEQLEGGAVDGRADVFALGCVLYQLVSGKLPFDGPSAAAIAVARLTGDPVPLRAVANVPEGVARLVMDALARRREARPDAHVLAARIAQLRGGRADETVAAIETPSAAPRALHVARLDADDATRTLADDLATAIADGLVNSQGIRVARDAGDSAVELTVRAAGDRVRVRARLVDARGDVVWADRAEGSKIDSFALEDRVAELVGSAVRERFGRADGPAGKLRERYDAARDSLYGGPAKVRTGVTLLEQMLVEEPDDVWIATLLACALVKVTLQTGAADETAFARAEELALRSLERDPTNGQAYYALALVRSLSGEHAESIAAAHAALRRLPLMGEPHVIIGRVLGWTGRVGEALQRYDLALRLDPRLVDAANEKVLLLALAGDLASARRMLDQLEQGHLRAGVLARLRLVSWLRDDTFTRQTLAMMTATPSGGAWELALPAFAAYVDGDRVRMRTVVTQAMTRLTSTRVIPRHRAYMHQIATEMFMLGDARESALEHLAKAVAIGGFIDLNWLDHCPSLETLRVEPAFAQGRAAVAERVAHYK